MRIQLTNVIEFFAETFQPFSGSTEASSESMSILAGDDGVFATASLLGITITPEQKVIEVLDRRENILEEEEEDQIVIEGEERIEELPIDDDNNGLAERMEICPSIPMFDLAGLATLAQWHGQQERGGEGGEEVPEGPVENEVDTSSLPSVVTKNHSFTLLHLAGLLHLQAEQLPDDDHV